MVEDSRFRLIEEKLAKLETAQILAANNAEHANKAFADLSKRLDSLQAGINKLLWAGGLLVLGALGNFILNGGLNAV